MINTKYEYIDVIVKANDDDSPENIILLNEIKQRLDDIEKNLKTDKK